MHKIKLPYYPLLNREGTKGRSMEISLHHATSTVAFFISSMKFRKR
jgi:hypothetical protein